MRRGLAPLLLLSACGGGSGDNVEVVGENGFRMVVPETPTPSPAPIPPLVPPAAAPSAGPARYVGQWAANRQLCRDGIWNFQERHLSTAGEVSCDFTDVKQAPGGYDVMAVCLAEGEQTRETIKLRFAESARAMLVESNTLGPIGLIRCDGANP